MSKDISLLMHMHQPSWQYPGVCDKITKKCYGWLLRNLSKQKDFKTTVNLTGSLTEQVDEKVIKYISDGLDGGSIELTGTAKYHPILPLIPEDEIKRQIELNRDLHLKIFEGVWEPSESGFFSPEMAFSNDLARIVKEMGYKWMVTNDSVYTANNGGDAPKDFVATIEDLPVFFRSTKLSNRFSFPTDHEGKPINTLNGEQFAYWLGEEIKEGNYGFLSMDMETIGNHNYYTDETIDYFAQTLSNIGIRSRFVSSLLDVYSKRLKMDTSKDYKGSWSTSEEHIREGNYFPLWMDPNNEIHKLQWEFIGYVTKEIKLFQKNFEGYDKARKLLDEGSNSCQMWWAAPENMKKDDFDPEHILGSARMLLSAIESLRGITSSEYAKANGFYLNIKEKIDHR